MTNEQKYKYATIVLVLIVIVLGVMLTSKPEPTVSNALESAGDDVSDCRTALAEWRAEFGTTTTPLTEDARNALNKTLEACQENTADAQETLE